MTITTSTTRRFEFILVLAVFTGYLFSSLTYDAWNFEAKMRDAINDGVSVRTILNDLASYDHNWNHNMPVIVAGIISFIAWYLFHYIFFPKFREEKVGAFELTLSIIITGLIISATFVWLNSIDVTVRRNHHGNIVGLRDVSHYRNLFLFSDAIAIFSIMAFYEIAAQGYYRLTEKLESEPNGRFLQYIILLLVCGFAFMIVMSQRFIPNVLLAVGMRQALGLVLFGIMVFCLQEYYFRKVYGVMHARQLQASNLLPVLNYLIIFSVAMILIWGIMTRFYFNSAITLLLIGTALQAFAISIVYWRKAQQNTEDKLTAEVSTKSAELSNLRSQINPHFLFNALNTLYGTALSENSEKTADGIQKLGDMMRFMLHENNRDRIPLSAEIAYLHNYIDIQRMRLDETQNIEIRVNISDAPQDIYIAPMLLSPFIENAFKHGISLTNASWIFITLTLDESHVFFKVHNSKHARQDHDPEKNHSGIGLANVEKRLKLIYPGRYNLNIQDSSQDYFVSLTLRY